MRFNHDDDMIFCLRDDVRDCGYAFRFGSGFFCHHPKRGEIVAQTNAHSGE